jgi:LysM repeat protein
MSILSAPADAASGVTDPIAVLIKNPFSTSVPPGRERPQDFPGGFQISELVNGVLNPETVIRWVGNAMPMQPFTWGGEQRLVSTYYAGNPEPAIQVLGAKEGPVTVHGRWKDKRFKDPRYYGVSYQYNLALNEMRKRGNLVCLSMQGGAGKWVRYGFIEKGEFKMNKLSWIDYEVTFLIVSETKPQNNYFAAPEKNSPSAVKQSLINAATAFQSTYSAVPKSMPLSLAGLMNNLIGDVAKNVNLVTNFVNTVVTTAQDIQASANRALGLINNARAFISKLTRTIDGFSHSFETLSTQGSAKGQVTDTYTNLAYIGETMNVANSLSALLAQMQAQFEALTATIPKARYKVQVNDTLQNISVKFFGTSANWTDIYDFNKLQTTALTPGTVLEIPDVASPGNTGSGGVNSSSVVGGS